MTTPQTIRGRVQQRRVPVARGTRPVATRSSGCTERQMHNRCVGEWCPNAHMGRNMSFAARRYQRQITRRSATLDYRLTCNGESADFDGYRNRMLLEAKFYGPTGDFMQAVAALSGMPSRMSMARAEIRIKKILAQARMQLRLARKARLGLTWYVASNEARAALSTLFARNGVRDIPVVHRALWQPTRVGANVTGT